MLFVSPPPQPPKQIVIWVHGTRMQEYFSPKNAKSKLFGKLSYSPTGLHAAHDIDKNIYLHSVAKLLHTADSTSFDPKHIYLFGWSGKLNVTERKKAAHELYAAISSLQKKYSNEYKISPPIMIITHSHGGNVALNLAAIPENNIFIDKLVLLACPVQKETAHLIDSPLFKNIYSLHSHRDAIQVLDPQGLYLVKKEFEKEKQTSFLSTIQNFFKKKNNNNFFSERHFKPHKKMKQAVIEWKTKAPWTCEDVAIFGKHAPALQKIATHIDKKSRGLLHLEFVLPSFIEKLPGILSDLDNQSCNSNEEITIQL